MPVELEISSVAYRGSGISRPGGIVTFVPRTLPGERILAEVVSVRKNFQVARLIEVLRPSPDRIDSECLLPDRTPVPGCAYDFAKYDAEVAIKDGQLRDFLRRFNLPESIFLPPFASPAPLRYRNKATFHVRGGMHFAAGYFGDDNRTVIDVPSCPLSSPEINAAWADIRKSLQASPARCPATVTLRHTEKDGVVSWTDETPPQPGRRLVEHSPAGDLLVPCDGFYQINPFVSGALVEQVRDWIAEIAAGGNIDLALDLFCGVGPFALAAARLGIGRVVGVETSRPSIKCARLNAERLSLPAAEFHCRDAARFLADNTSSLPLDRAVVIADPPRSGFQREAIDALCASPLRHAIFVSCDPATLARDLAIAVSAGFAISKVRLFDMFPRTIHFETAVVLKRM